MFLFGLALVFAGLKSESAAVTGLGVSIAVVGLSLSLGRFGIRFVIGKKDALRGPLDRPVQ